MILKTVNDYMQEIDRVEAAMEKTDSDHLRRDYEKYLKRLKKQMRKVCMK